MSKNVYVGGSGAGVGKTFVSLGLLDQLSKTQKVGAWKAIDLGHVDYNAADVLTDGERLQNTASMTEHMNLVNPFILNENLPPVLAAQRDGIKISSEILEQYFQKISKRYDRMVMEGARGLYTPLTKDPEGNVQCEIDYLKQLNPTIVWVTSIGEADLSSTLLQIHALKQANLDIAGIVLSNRNQVKNADLLHYQWLALEEQTDIRVAGLLPFLESQLEDPQAIGRLMRKNLDESFWTTLEEVIN